ncbi:MAG TPA: ABC transporter permease, partial [Phycisphaerae bacterium]|nr:ABC transporter permease [Phycisphaerae bacterium]
QTSAHITIWPRERNRKQSLTALSGAEDATAAIGFADYTFPRKRDMTGYGIVSRMVSENPEVLAITPFVKGDATISRGKANIGITLEGINPVEYSRVISFAKHFKDSQAPRLESNDIAIGYRMAEKLGVGLGGIVHVSTVKSPARQEMRVKAIFKSGFYDNDLQHAFVSLNRAQVLFRMGNAVSGLAVRCSDLNRAQGVSDQLSSTLDYKVRNWMDDNASLLQEMSTVKRVTTFISVMVALVASVGMANVFSMFVLNRQKELAILRAMGSSRFSLRSILLLEGCFIWIVGTLLGWAAVLGVMAWEQANPYQVSAETYGIGSYATRPDMQVFLLATLLSGVTMIGSALWSGRRAAKMNPADVIFGR